MRNRPRKQNYRRLACNLFVFFTACFLLSGSLSAAQDSNLPPLAVPTTSLPRGFVRVQYRQQIEAQNGTTPYKWQVSDGALPKGLSLNSDGVLEGAALESGEFHFVATVSDSARPALEHSQPFVLQIFAPIMAKWDRYPKVNGQRIEGSLKASNQTDDDFDFTVVVVAVNDIGRATALGYQHFTLPKNTLDQQIPFGENLPPGTYQINADVVGEVAAVNRIYRARLVSSERLPVVQQP